MNDRELLEKAAKAARLPVNFNDTAASSRRVDYWIEPEGPYWNPLEDDGDALRLAVKLGLQVECSDYNKGAVVGGFDGHGRTIFEEIGSDPYAAARRAIVRAAAALGGATNE